MSGISLCRCRDKAPYFNTSPCELHITVFRVPRIIGFGGMRWGRWLGPSLLLNVFTSLQPGFLTDAMEITNKIFVCIFSFEMVIKLLGDGIAMYLSSGQNVFDGIIVIVRYVY